jgi:hypothetical protein
MRLRFTIRDLLWLTLAVALGVGWRMDHRRMTVGQRLAALPSLTGVALEFFCLKIFRP